MAGLETATVLFALVIALSLLVERVMEILATFYELLDSWGSWHKYWTSKTIRLKHKLESKLRVFEYVEPSIVARALNRYRSILLNEDERYSGTVPVLSGDLIRITGVKISLKLIGIALGILLAVIIEIDLIEVWKASSSVTSQIPLCPTLHGEILSGIVIGLGTGPVHKIITAMERRRERLVSAEGGAR